MHSSHRSVLRLRPSWLQWPGRNPRLLQVLRKQVLLHRPDTSLGKTPMIFSAALKRQRRKLLLLKRKVISKKIHILSVLNMLWHLLLADDWSLHLVTRIGWCSGSDACHAWPLWSQDGSPSSFAGFCTCSTTDQKRQVQTHATEVCNNQSMFSISIRNYWLIVSRLTHEMPPLHRLQCLLPSKPKSIRIAAAKIPRFLIRRTAWVESYVSIRKGSMLLWLTKCARTYVLFIPLNRMQSLIKLHYRNN